MTFSVLFNVVFMHSGVLIIIQQISCPTTSRHIVKLHSGARLGLGLGPGSTTSFLLRSHGQPTLLYYYIHIEYFSESVVLCHNASDWSE